MPNYIVYAIDIKIAQDGSVLKSKCVWSWYVKDCKHVSTAVYACAFFKEHGSACIKTEETYTQR